jgi:MFS family permease
MVARIFQSIFNSPAGAIGGAVVVDLFFARERAQKMGIWTLMVTIGNPLGPFLMGFVATRAGWRWIFWIFTIVSYLRALAFIRGHPS